MDKFSLCTIARHAFATKKEVFFTNQWSVCRLKPDGNQRIEIFAARTKPAWRENGYQAVQQIKNNDSVGLPLIQYFWDGDKENGRVDINSTACDKRNLLAVGHPNGVVETNASYSLLDLLFKALEHNGTVVFAVPSFVTSLYEEGDSESTCVRASISANDDGYLHFGDKYDNYADIDFSTPCEPDGQDVLVYRGCID